MNKLCRNCGKTFSGEGKKIYCSEECAKNAHTEQIRSWKISHRKSSTVCKICGRPVQDINYADYISRPRLHYDCIMTDLLLTLSSGQHFTKIQMNRKSRMGITNKEIMEYGDLCSTGK